MIDKLKIKNLINERKRLHPDDPRVKDYWKLLTKELIINEEDTISFIQNCSEHDVYWLSEIFEDISEVFKSQKFIDNLKNVQMKYSNLDLEMDIMFAERALKMFNENHLD